MRSEAHVPLQHPVSSPTYVSRTRNQFLRVWKEIEIPLVVAIGVCSITLGTIGFQIHFASQNEPYTLSRSLYASIELVEFMGGNLPPPIPWQLEVARWLSPAVTLYAVFLGLAAIFHTELEMLHLRMASEHVVICGLGQKGLLLAKNFRADNNFVVAIERDGTNPNIAICRDLGVLVLAGDARDELTLRKAGVGRAKHLISVCGEDGTNAEVAVKARTLVQGRRPFSQSCAIHIQDPRLWLFLRRHEFSPSSTHAFRLDFFNIYDHGARQLLREFPLRAGPTGSTKSPHLLLVDLGQFGEQLVIHAARLWYPTFQKTHSKLRITVVDPDVERKLESLCLQYSLVKKVCQFYTFPAEMGSPEFQRAEFLDGGTSGTDVSTIYVCLEDETVGVSGALSLISRAGAAPIQILVRMTEDAGLASMLRGQMGAGGGLANLHAFGLLERTCKPSLLNDGSHEAVARAIHEEYVRNETARGQTVETNPALVAWEDLGEELRDANRGQAADIGVKLNMLGCDVVPWTDYGGDKFDFLADEIEMMAEIEHERWCRQNMAQGWTYAPVRDDRRKQHPSLLAWDDPRFSEVEKEKDRATVRMIPRFLALAGFQICHIPAVKGEDEKPQTR